MVKCEAGRAQTGPRRHTTASVSSQLSFVFKHLLCLEMVTVVVQFSLDEMHPLQILRNNSNNCVSKLDILSFLKVSFTGYIF